MIDQDGCKKHGLAAPASLPADSAKAKDDMNEMVATCMLLTGVFKPAEGRPLIVILNRIEKARDLMVSDGIVAHPLANKLALVYEADLQKRDAGSTTSVLPAKSGSVKPAKATAKKNEASAAKASLPKRAKKAA